MLMQMMVQMFEQLQELRADHDADREEVRVQIYALRSEIVTPTPTPHSPQRWIRVGQKKDELA